MTSHEHRLVSIVSKTQYDCDSLKEMLRHLPKIKKFSKKLIFELKGGLLIVAVILFGTLAYVLYVSVNAHRDFASVMQIYSLELGSQNNHLRDNLAKQFTELTELKNQDQYKINAELKSRITSIEQTYTKAVNVYEEIVKLKEISDDTQELDDEYTSALTLLADQKYEDASQALSILSSKVADERNSIIASYSVPATITQSNDAPSSGYSYQQVSTDVGNFAVSIVAADLTTTKVIVDTASSGDCANECPVLSLADYVSRNNAYAGVNGTYFCPASYPSCAGKTNSFDLLVMNKDKHYFNSSNNVYSTNPAVIFGGSYIRFVGQALDWGRDTNIDSMLSNYPMLVQGGNLAFAGDSDPKKGSKAARPFVSNKGTVVYIGVVFNSTVVEAGHTLKAMGMENALNLDSGGSTALYSGGYKVGPGRNIPNAILFVRK